MVEEVIFIHNGNGGDKPHAHTSVVWGGLVVFLFLRSVGAAVVVLALTAVVFLFCLYFFTLLAHSSFAPRSISIQIRSMAQSCVF